MNSTYKNLSEAYENDINDISKLTDLWIQKVTIDSDPDAIFNLFCQDGNLVGTVSQIKRKGNDIKSYFDYFAKLPEIRVV